MFRSAALRLGTGAAAGAAAGRLTRSSNADVRSSRPVSLPRATGTVETSERRQLEDDAWLEVSLNEDGVVFGKAEVDEVVEEIVGLIPDDDELTGGTAADEVIDRANSSVRGGSYMENILRASQRLVSHSAVQSAALTAMQEDEQLRQMIEELSNTHIEVVDADAELPVIEYEGVAGAHVRGNPLKTFFEDIGYHFGRLLKSLKDVTGKIARILMAALSWMVGMVKEAIGLVSGVMAAVDKLQMEMLPIGAQLLVRLFPFGRAAPVVVAGAMLILVVLFIKRQF